VTVQAPRLPMTISELLAVLVAALESPLA
jgi:hypothetical protein